MRHDVDLAVDLAAALENALTGIADTVAGVGPGWLAAGVLLHVANQVARGRGWYAILRRATHDDPDVRRRDAIAAWVAGAGAGGIASARGGDAVRVLLLRPRVPRAGAPCLAGTIVAEGAAELALGAAILAIALALGLGPALDPPGAGALWILPAALLVAATVLAVRRVPRVRRVAAGVGRGCAPLRDPRGFARAVLPWQLASRACRAGALACFLAAFGLPVTPAVVLLVMLAQGGARLVPFAPASVGAGAAMLAASFEPVTGSAVPAGQVAAFFVGTSTVLTIVGTALSLGICVRSACWPSLGDALRARRRVRVPVPAEAYASANAGRSLRAGAAPVGPRAIERAATVPTP
jgi:uncharacterized membrane protein YbhN (UPF0104 family)